MILDQRFILQMNIIGPGKFSIKRIRILRLPLNLNLGLHSLDQLISQRSCILNLMEPLLTLKIFDKLGKSHVIGKFFVINQPNSLYSVFDNVLTLLRLKFTVF